MWTRLDSKRVSDRVMNTLESATASIHGVWAKPVSTHRPPDQIGLIEVNRQKVRRILRPHFPKSTHLYAPIRYVQVRVCPFKQRNSRRSNPRLISCPHPLNNNPTATGTPALKNRTGKRTHQRSPSHHHRCNLLHSRNPAKISTHQRSSRPHHSSSPPGCKLGNQYRSAHTTDAQTSPQAYTSRCHRLHI